MPVADVPEAPIPEEGKASIGGVLYNYLGRGVLPGTVFYLTPAVEEGGTIRPPVVYVGPREEAGDVRGQSGKQGQLIVNNIPPGKYYLAVWAPYDWILVVESETDPTPRLIVLEPDQQANLGIVYISWP
jgi:hypothetical protein